MKKQLMINRVKFIFKSVILNILNILNISIVRVYKSPIDHFDIDLLLDVGANIGQYASRTRQNGYKGRMVSFEPLSDAYDVLVSMSIKDNLWTVYPRCAVGSDNGVVDVNISQNSYSSSVLPILSSHISAAPKSQYIGKIETKLLSLDSIFNKYKDSNNIYLKIDTQGFEKNVLNGVLKNLKNIKVVQLELSSTPLYENQELYSYFFSFFDENNFSLWSLESEFSDKKTGRMLQFDAIFVNNTIL